jgi:phospholipid/cholesterol/gamma-HCH transport system ATP-binding protein
MSTPTSQVLPATEPVIHLIDADIPRTQPAAPGPALHEVQWRIARGDFWAVGAFAGTGKTDLLCTAAGLQRPLKGSLLLFGEDTAEMGEEELVATRLKVAMIFSSGRLFSSLSVAENITLPLQYHQKDKRNIAQAVDAALELVGIQHLKEQTPADIPAGMHQRIALARALALSPEVLLIDNPLGGVDPRQGRWWLEFLCDLNKGHDKLSRPMTIVVATDDLRPWRDTGRQFAILKKNRFEPVGDREAVKLTQDSLVRELLLQS